MKRISTLSSIIGLSLLATTALATAADNAPLPHPGPAKHASHKRFDPVQHTRHKLDGLEAKLNLREEQKPAWQPYSDAALARAGEKAAAMQEMHAKRSEPRQEPDTAAKLDKAAEFMRAQADRLQKVARDTRAFQQVLTPEQQTIFDLYWKSQQRRTGGHRPA